MTTSTNYGSSTHYLTWPTANSYACGANAVGRRNTSRDTDPKQTTCIHCKEVIRYMEEAKAE